MSSLNDSDEHTSPPATEGSLGVQVANSHFSNISASKGNNGCLKIIKNNIMLLDYENKSRNCKCNLEWVDIDINYIKCITVKIISTIYTNISKFHRINFKP